MTKWSVGDEVIVTQPSFSRTAPREVQRHTVIKVARKYFTTAYTFSPQSTFTNEYQFEIADGRQKPANPNFTNYLAQAYTPEAYEAKLRRDALSERLRQLGVRFEPGGPFGGWDGRKLSSDALERLVCLLDEEVARLGEQVNA